MSTLRLNIQKLIFPAIAILLYGGMVLFSLKYEMNPYFWYDDAGQFWISQGLNHDSFPLSPTGNLLDVIENNAGYNLDPGGYGIILHYWSKVSANYIWLRTLSFCFFLLASMSLAYLGYKWTGNVNIGIWAGFVPFFIPMIFYNGFTLRAYSMEVLGCLICVMAMHSLQNGMSYKKLLGWSLLISIFLTSRYSFIIAAFSTSLYVLYLICRYNTDNKQKLAMALTYATPLFAVLIAIYLTALRFQNPGLETLDYLPYISTNWKVILHKASLRHLFYLFIIVWIAFVLRKDVKLNPYRGLIFVTILTNILFFVFSCLGMHPWDGGTDRCISMLTLTIVAITAFWCELIKMVYEKINIQYILLAFICLQLANYKTDINTPVWQSNNETLLEDWKEIVLADEKVYVDRWESPCLRYQIEYGSLQNTPNYPSNFTFMTAQKHGMGFEDNCFENREDWYANQSLDELYDKYDILIAPEFYRKNPQLSERWTSINEHHIIWLKQDN